MHRLLCDAGVVPPSLCVNEQELLNATALRVMGVQFERRPNEFHESDTVSVHTFKIRDDHLPGASAARRTGV